MIQPTGTCWFCAHPCKEGELFCKPKHEEQYRRKEERKIRKGKRAGYGIVGDTH